MNHGTSDVGLDERPTTSVATGQEDTVQKGHSEARYAHNALAPDLVPDSPAKSKLSSSETSLYCRLALWLAGRIQLRVDVHSGFPQNVDKRT